MNSLIKAWPSHPHSSNSVPLCCACSLFSCSEIAASKSSSLNFVPTPSRLLELQPLQQILVVAKTCPTQERRKLLLRARRCCLKMVSVKRRQLGARGIKSFLHFRCCAHSSRVRRFIQV